MSPSLPEFTLGVEEEYQIIDPTTRELRSQGEQVLAEAQKTLGKDIQPEVYLSQIEIATPVCHTLADVRSALLYLRGQVIAAAAKTNSQIAAAGTHPFSEWAKQSVTPKERYQGLVRDYQQIMRELIIFGCHVHVGISDREIAIQVMNRARTWLAPMLALTANSPFWLGEDTGYASYRTLLWSRWATAGPPSSFASRADYDALVDALIAARAVRDGTKLYWDIRPSERFETLEFRVTDVCATVDEAVMMAGITRALVQTCYEQVVQEKPFADVRPELLRAAQWRAARFGLDGDLIDVVNQRSLSAPDLIETLLTFIKPALETQGDWDEVSTIVYQLLENGNGATRQRAVYQQTGRLEDVVDYLVAETARGTVSD
ncbi:carboxylate-amine ligase [Oculatella sp. LEGE 06141]|uniref:carboxylate-amine ligase n=1 Tax=Oculatella sp. LEGE 06141 TaxID=1828648 RepID=UPI00187E7EF8|nr:carboxylate-amine ligase [Oculatella sp. LEGE 06141]MBE9181940.1 carboxylate-amine ligase [Oculatella sp. LEGE 06141]